MSHDNYSLSAKVYNHIRDGILAGTFAKGDELKEKNIGDELGVSRTPVREALRQLELEGLVSIIPNKGAFVEGVSTDDIRDIYEIRALLEGLCARWAATRISDEPWRPWRRIFISRSFTRKRAMQRSFLSWTIGFMSCCMRLAEARNL